MRLNDRCNQQWAHPEALDEVAYTIENCTAQGLEGIEDLTAEMQAKFQIENFGQELFKSLDETCGSGYVQWKDAGEWKEYFTEHGCPEETDAPPVRILVRIPKGLKEKERLPVIFTIPGGGMTSGGTPEINIQPVFKAMRNNGLKAVVVNTQYRLAPSNKYPASVNDCHAAYIWMIEHAEELHINTDKIVLFGGSTGGHLVLSLGFRLKRYHYHGPMPRGIIPLVPVMDDVAFTDSFRMSFVSEAGTGDCFDGACARKCMKLWLGDYYGDPALSPEAVPNRAGLEDMKGYPPVWFPCNAEFDPSRDTAYAFASLLHRAGVFCDVHTWGAASHLISMAGESDLGKRVWGVIAGALRDSLKYDFRRPWLDK